MESPSAAIETNRDIEQETPRIATVDKERDQVVRKLVAEVVYGFFVPWSFRSKNKQSSRLD